MVLGTYHFANPGLDAKNVNADDVLAPKRQGELEDLANALAAFRPSKIMVEAAHGDNRVQQAYQRHLAGSHTLRHNETEQIGFRLGKKLNLPRIYPIDYPMRMSGLRPDELDDNWRPKPVASSSGTPAVTVAAPPPAPLSEEDRLFRASTITQILLRLNDPAGREAEHAESYMGLLLPEDGPALYAQSDLFVNWYKRNVRMFANIVRYAEAPQDKLLVVVGSGHLKILRDLARDAPYLCLVEPISYLRRSLPTSARN
jgi:hypothetical protein